MNLRIIFVVLVQAVIVGADSGCCKEVKCVDGGHCCIHLDDQLRKAETCCLESQRCTTDGCIDNDRCSNLGQSQCLDSVQFPECSWCCTTNKCEQAGFTSCPEMISSEAQTCTDECNTYSTCDECKAQELCGWCCEDNRCLRGDNMDKNPSPCHDTFLGLATYSNGAVKSFEAKCSECISCELRPEVVFVSSSDSLNVAVVIVPIVATFVLILAAVISTIICRNRRAKEARAEAHATAQNRMAMAEKLKPSRAKKHGFGDPLEGQERTPPKFTQPDYGDDAVDEDYTCIGCYDAPKEVLYLPCKHHCYCRTCAVRHENMHIEKKNRHRLEQQQSEAPTTTLPICSLCRKPVEWMVHVEAVNTPDRLRERRDSTPRTPDCNTPDSDDKPVEVTVDRDTDGDDEEEENGANDPF